MAKKEEKEIKKKVTEKQKKKEKESLMSKIRNFIRGVKQEWKRIKWPSKKSMIKYSIATIIFIISCSLFFYIIDVILAFLHTLGK